VKGSVLKDQNCLNTVCELCIGTSYASITEFKTGSLNQGDCSGLELRDDAISTTNVIHQRRREGIVTNNE